MSYHSKIYKKSQSFFPTPKNKQTSKKINRWGNWQLTLLTPWKPRPLPPMRH